MELRVATAVITSIPNADGVVEFHPPIPSFAARDSYDDVHGVGSHLVKSLVKCCPQRYVCQVLYRTAHGTMTP